MDSEWEDVREELCTLLAIGFESGEPELDTITRIVLLERQKNICLSLAFEALRAEADASLERDLRAVAKGGNVLEWKVPIRSVGL
jgi:hypothetical protein